jgi:hypothetical protein
VPNSSSPLGATEIRSHLQEVADLLVDGGPRHTLIVVGGALLAWHGLRDSTRDVDSARRIDPEVRDAVERVARRHDLAIDWLNDDAAGFLPFTFEEDHCGLLLDSPRLIVLAAPLDQVFLMKLYRLSAQDYEDLVSLWNLCEFVSPEDVVASFREAFPHAPEDPGLIHLVADVERAAGPGGPTQPAR